MLNIKCKDKLTYYVLQFKIFLLSKLFCDNYTRIITNVSCQHTACNSTFWFLKQSCGKNKDKLPRSYWMLFVVSLVSFIFQS